MQISSRFTIAIHMLVCMETFKKDTRITSDFLAASVSANPVVIRRILSQLKNAEIIDVARGTGGASIKKELKNITLLDIFQAVECVGNKHLFHFHENPNEKCLVGRNIHHLLDDRLTKAQTALENELASTSLQDLLDQEMN